MKMIVAQSALDLYQTHVADYLSGNRIDPPRLPLPTLHRENEAGHASKIERMRLRMQNLGLRVV